MQKNELCCEAFDITLSLSICLSSVVQSAIMSNTFCRETSLYNKPVWDFKETHRVRKSHKDIIEIPVDTKIIIFVTSVIRK